MSNAQPVPEGMTGVIPHLTVKGAAKAIDYYKKVFGATELSRFDMPDGSIMHATIKVGNGVVMLNDEFKEMGCIAPSSGGSPVYLMMYVPDVDATFNRALEAGAETKMPVADQFWGDRYGLLVDPFGHYWEIATHKEDLSNEELARRGREAMSQMAKK
ncbi:MAG: VOC family protein [Candidatus Eiseniibacteriota bacterium]